MDFTTNICNQLGILVDTQLKRPIRGLKGITTYSLIDSLIHSNSIIEAGVLLGYTDNPIKQCIRKVLHPIFTDRSHMFGENSQTKVSNWRNALLSTINHRYCSSCDSIKHFNMFHSNIRTPQGLSIYCASCNIHNSKLQKFYIEQRTPIWSDLELIKEFYNNCPVGYEVDHILPLRGTEVSGLHIISNLQYLTIADNRAKLNKMI